MKPARPNIELSVTHATNPLPAYGEEGVYRLVSRADVAALAAYLSAIVAEPIEGSVTIGRLQVEIHVGRCGTCRGLGKKSYYDATPCWKCKGTGLNAAADELEVAP